jgi:hypothetical protein
MKRFRMSEIEKELLGVTVFEFVRDGRTDPVIPLANTVGMISCIIHIPMKASDEIL